MRGNEVGDRVHNFFAPGNLSQGQHHSQVVDGNWQVLGNNPWVASQRHIGGQSSNPNNFNLQQSDIERGYSGHSLQVPHGLYFTQSTHRPDFARSQSQSPHPNLNGHVQGHQVFQTRQTEAKFLGVDTKSDQCNVTSRGLSFYESQEVNGPEHHTKISVRSETSESPASFDFFGDQQQLMNGQQPGMLQSLPHQQSGFNDMHQILQQQIMFRKMQELQRLQQLEQLEVRQQNSINHISSISNQGSDNYSPALINSPRVTEAPNYPWANEPTMGNANWLQRASPNIQGSSNRIMFSPEQGQETCQLGLVPQQVDQSLYRLPISSIRGTQNQGSHIPMDKPQMQQISTSSNSFPGSQYAVFSDQVSMQDGTLGSTQDIREKNMVGHASGRGLVNGLNLENLHQVNALQRNASMQEFHGRQELAGLGEALQEKTAMLSAPTQTWVALDPTEERILFGMDDNVWDAFGGSINMSAGGSNLLGGTGFLNGLPSVHSGSWSALMQSAVAETSGNDIGVQEEWSSLSFPNIEIPSGNRQHSTYNDSRKEQTVLAENSQITSGSVPLSDETYMNNNYCSVPELKQPEHKFSYEQGESVQTNSSHRSIQQSSKEVSKWLIRDPVQNPLAEGSQIYGNAAHSLDAEMNATCISGSWTPQQSTSTYNTSGQPCDKPNCWNIIEPSSPGGDVEMKTHKNEYSLHHSQSNDKKGSISEEKGHVGGTWKADSICNSTVELEHVNSATASQQVNREVSTNTSRARQEAGQLLPNGHHLNYWKPVESSLKCRGSKDSGKSQHHLNKVPQFLESLVNSSDKEAVKMHEMENNDKKENSSGSYRSNLSRHASVGCLKENVWSDASDSHTVPVGKQKSSQKSSGQAGQKASGPRKFQYHPMGNLDEDMEPLYGLKHDTHSLALSKSHNLGYIGQSKSFAHVSKNSTEMEKGHLPDLQGNPKGIDEAPSRGIHSSYVPNISAASDRSLGFCAPNKAAQSSQNILELLHKVDQSMECGSVPHFRSSEMPEADNSDGSVGHLLRHQSTASQGFGLQLAPPSHRLPVSNCAFSPRSSAQTVNSHSLSHTTPKITDKSCTLLASRAQVQSLPASHETFQGEVNNIKTDIPEQTGNESLQYMIEKTISSAVTSGFPYSRSQLQNEQVTGTSGQKSAFFDRLAYYKQTEDSSNQALTGHSVPASLPDSTGSIQHSNCASSADTSLPPSIIHSCERVLDPQISAGKAVPVSNPSITSEISQQGTFSKMLSNVWTSVPAQQRELVSEPHKVALNLFQSQQLDNNVESTSSAPRNLEDKNSLEGGNGGPSEFGASYANSQGFVYGEEQPAKESSGQQLSSGNIDLAEKSSASKGKASIVKQFSDASPSNLSSSQSDIEAFGCSLKPSDFLHQNYTPLNQMWDMKSTEIDPNYTALKRFKGLDSDLGGQKVDLTTGQSNDHNTMGGDASDCLTAVPSGDSKILSFSGRANNRERNASSQPGNLPSEDMLAFGGNDPQNYSNSNSTASVKVEHSQISPQMARSWFNEFGAFKNGQMLLVSDAQKSAPLKSLEQVNAAANSSQVGNTCQNSIAKTVAINRLSSPQSLLLDVTDQHLVVVRPKKRKSATSELLPWHKEVAQGSESLVTISMAEVDWAKAANRLIDKIEDESEMVEDGPSMLKPKRRLIWTTQLVQQLFRPPPAAVLSADALPNYESVAYFVARLALRDTCSLISYLGSNSHGHLDGKNVISKKHKTSEKIGDPHLSIVVEDFIGKARKQENDFLRLDRRASIFELKVEWQEIEKFSLINRFAKFHGRGQIDGAETSNAKKPCPQRYVTALSVPRNLPDRVQCLSL